MNPYLEPYDAPEQDGPDPDECQCRIPSPDLDHAEEHGPEVYCRGCGAYLGEVAA